ncbi:hypothetical protein V5F53_10980 [Xanthobacter sp. V4C-4]|uniref:hypothetical protein n=1 Tax=Xanthobacter cornucopiae TaxID=3119924 RepID=UPI00372B5D97
MTGPLPVPWSELQAWLSLSGEHASRADVALLRQMDAAFLSGLDDWRAWHETLTKNKGK